MHGRVINVNGSGEGLEVFTPTNPGNVSITGSNLQEQKTQANATAGVVTFSDVIKTIEIYNTDSTNTGTFSVNGISITVPPTKVFKSAIGGTPSNLVTITGATTYILSRYT